MTICRACHTEKAADAFYRSQPRRCKECVKAAVRANRVAKIDQYRAFDVARASQPHRVAARKAYVQTPAGKLAHNRATKKYAVTAADRRRAQVLLNNAVRDGRVTAWPLCAAPECDGQKPEAHHPDYSNPLDVVWLCNRHHREAHAIANNL